MRYKVEFTFVEPLLGTTPQDEQLYEDFVASKIEESPGDESATLPEALAKGTTGFHRLDGQPILYDYMIKGFFKEACGMLRRVRGTKSAGLTAYKRNIDGLIFVEPRRIPIELNGEIQFMSRPLRAATAQGDRVALVRSEVAPVGSRIIFFVTILDPSLEIGLIKEWLSYGKWRGLGQWRNASWGTFNYTLEELPE